MRLGLVPATSRLKKAVANSAEALLLAAWCTSRTEKPVQFVQHVPGIDTLANLHVNCRDPTSNALRSRVVDPSATLDLLGRAAGLSVDSDGLFRWPKGHLAGLGDELEDLAAISQGINSATGMLHALEGLAELLSEEGSVSLPAAPRADHAPLWASDFPARIEAFDVSHLFGDHTMAASSVLVNGVLQPSLYRSYTIRGVPAADDCAALYSALLTRFLVEPGSSSPPAARSMPPSPPPPPSPSSTPHPPAQGFRHTAGRRANAASSPTHAASPRTRAAVPQAHHLPKCESCVDEGVADALPDVLLIDGGKGQLEAAQRALAVAGLTRRVRVLALAKQQEVLYLPHRRHGVALSRTSPTLLLLQRLRDECHASALLAHRQRRHAHGFASVLDGAPIDAAARRALRQHFASATELRDADVAALTDVLGAESAEALSGFLQLRRSAPPSATLAEMLRGHESAVAAAAASSRRATSGVAAGIAEARASRWWRSHRAQRMEELRDRDKVEQVLTVLNCVRSAVDADDCARDASGQLPLTRSGEQSSVGEGDAGAAGRGSASVSHSEDVSASASSASERLSLLEGALEPWWPPPPPQSKPTPSLRRRLRDGVRRMLRRRPSDEPSLAAVDGAAVLGAQADGRMAESHDAELEVEQFADALHGSNSLGASSLDNAGSAVDEEVDGDASTGESATARPLGARRAFAPAWGAFELHAPYEASGDQPSAISRLVAELESGEPRVVLKGATGTGKTFVMAQTIAALNKPTLLIAPNKVLAAQLYSELRSFFPRNAVSFFVSHFDYYRPESYSAASATHTEKASRINEAIDTLRHQATCALFERRDTIVVASVSCIYGLGMPAKYLEAAILLAVGQTHAEDELQDLLRAMLYERSAVARERGQFSWAAAEGDAANASAEVELNVQLVNEPQQLRVVFKEVNSPDEAHTNGNEREGSAVGDDFASGDRLLEVVSISLLSNMSKSGIEQAIVDSVRGLSESELSSTFESKVQAEAEAHEALAAAVSEFVLYPASHHTVAGDEIGSVMAAIEEELASRATHLESLGQWREAERLRFRVNADLEQMRECGYCRGMENYARHLANRSEGEPPETLLDYMPQDDWLLLVDECHITAPQISAMFAGDHQRKRNLVAHGFRLPSALDNRPLTGAEFWARVPQAVLISATPGAEVERLCGVSPSLTELIVRPTGVPDPQVRVISAEEVGGVEDHLLAQIESRRAVGEKTLVTVLTKRSAEELARFLDARGVPAAWLHSDLKPVERLEAIDGLRNGQYDVLIGCNMLREGLDLPEVSLVAIIDADKQGFLRSETSLIQTIGRAARHVDGTALLYTQSGVISDAMRAAIDETERRRTRQQQHNEAHGLTPRGALSSSKGKAASRLNPVLALLQQKPSASDTLRSTLDAPQRRRYEAMCAWREEQAVANGVPRFRVMTDAMMLRVAVAAPSSAEELAAVRGIGPKTMKRHGEALMSVLQALAHRSDISIERGSAQAHTAETLSALVSS